MTRTELDAVEALAEEICRTEGISISLALDVAREELASLRAYAAEWDTWAAAWHDPQPARRLYAS